MIPEKYTYICVDLFAIVFPFIFSFTKLYDFKNYWKFYFPSNLMVAFVFILWDMEYTHLEVWGFDSKYTLGIYVYNLPIEEILFFICIPYACLFTYYCFRKFVFSQIKIQLNQAWIILGGISVLFGLYHFERLYTLAAFVSCGLTMIWSYKSGRLSFVNFLIFYLVILIPFYMFNGVLTGSFIDRIVVYYNDSENLGIRILTVPFEDIFYGLAMQLGIINLFEQKSTL